MRIAQDFEVSLTSFAEYTCKIGDKKKKQAESIRSNLGTEYELVKDFYKRLREGIIDFHKHSKQITALDAIARSQSDPKKMTSYPEVLHSYQRFIGRKDISWFNPPRGTWLCCL